MNFFKRITTLTRINDSIYELEKNLLTNQHARVFAESVEVLLVLRLSLFPSRVDVNLPRAFLDLVGDHSKLIANGAILYRPRSVSSSVLGGGGGSCPCILYRRFIASSWSSVCCSHSLCSSCLIS